MLGLRQTWWWAEQEREAVPKLSRLPLSKLLIVLALLLAGYFTLFSQRVDRDEQELQQEVAELRADRARLEAVRDYLYTDEYIEGAARRLLSLVRDGETLVIVSSSVTPTPAAEDDAETPYRTWWEQLYGP